MGGTMIKDPRIMDVFKVMLGMNEMDFTTGKEYEAKQEENKTTCYSDSSSVSRPQGTEKTEDPVIDNKEVVEDDLTEIGSEELKKREKLKAAIMLKEKGNKF